MSVRRTIWHDATCELPNTGPNHRERCYEVVPSSAYDACIATLEDLLALIDDGVLVRDIRRDHEPDWALRQLPLVRVLAAAQRLLADDEVKPSAEVVINAKANRRECWDGSGWHQCKGEWCPCRVDPKNACGRHRTIVIVEDAQ